MKKHFLSCAVLCGGISALAAATGETLLGSGGSLPGAFAVSLGLLLPPGIGLGLAALAVRALLPRGSRPIDWLRAIQRSDDATVSARILVVGAGSLLLVPVIYRIIFFFLTRFHHPGLAALALSATLLVLFPSVYLMGRRLTGLAAGLLRGAPDALALARRPLGSLVAVFLLWTAAILPPSLAGPSARGPFGFIGLLSKDGLGAGPLLSILAMTAIAAGALWFALDTKMRRTTLVVAATAVCLAVTGPLWAGAAASASPTSLDRLGNAGGLSQLIAKVARKMTDRDRDGHAPWMGGRDCDDTNPEIHPGARDIPDNGIDEDCSGQDLSLATLLEKTRSDTPTTALPEQQALTRPDLPDDVSVILITVDTFRWDSPGFMGNSRPVTPNLDKLVANGTIYERAYALGSYTAQSIPPMLTGKYASELLRNDRHETRISGREKFAAEYICASNVACNAILSHFLFEKHFGWNQGFEGWTVVGASPSGPGHIDSKYNSDAVANQAIKWLKAPANTEGRFWLWTHFMDPHKEYLDHPGFKSFGSDRRAMYDHELLYTDYHIGRMLDFFATLPAASRTIIIVTGDHGEAFKEHGRWCHGEELWEEIIRVPMAVTGPGIATKRISRPTSHIDLFPTLLDVFNVEIPSGIHGRSLLADWVTGQEIPVRPVIADQPKNPYYETRRVFIKDGWKLHDLPDTGTHRLFQITDDYERGDSLEKSEPDQFEKIKNAYDLFMATEFKPVADVRYTSTGVDNMPLPEGYTIVEGD